MWIVPKSESSPFRKEVQDKLNDGRFTRSGVVSLNYVFRWEDTPEGYAYWRIAYNRIKRIKWEDAREKMETVAA